ncbi:MAG: flavin monoamine oxidase family protein [Steroidobacteraceae bacterium]
MGNRSRNAPLTRRQLMMMIGAAAGSGASYHAMAQLGLADASPAVSRIPGSARARAGASVLVLGGGVAGMSAALELSRVGYKVTLLEHNKRPGGRCWSIRGGDTITELGGATQNCQFDKGFYLNPGPWRIPYDHRNLLSYIHELGVPLETQGQTSHNTLMHSSKYFGGKPVRVGTIGSSFSSSVAELLAKSTKQGALDQMVSKEDQERLLEAMRSWGQLDADYTYRGGRRDDHLMPAKPITREELLQSGFWSRMEGADDYHDILMQPVGGMDRVAYALYGATKEMVRLNSRVTSIRQDSKKVSVTYVDADSGANQRTLTADWCVCAMPLTVLSQMEIQVGSKTMAGIKGVPYSPAIKIGLQMKRRFWEEDDRIYGGITYTDLPIRQISYPSADMGTRGKGVLLGAYVIGGAAAYEFTSLSPEDRVKWAVEFGSQIHPQYKKEFENGVSVGWHRQPWILGCSAAWGGDLRAKHYENLRQIDGRIVFAGDHLSNLVAWQEGALTSSLDAIARLHQHALAA